ncbi:MAG: Rrf2 family transcriptional regulator, partial [Rhodococcus sp.]|nr:Rrf2 family transcriptional regulator [Rhodococcus sp. (in: high G+C Gram-positive bacteria)]
MQLTQFTDLGLRVVMRLAVLDADASPSTRDVAQQLNVSYSHATKVVTRLGELGIVTTRRGRGGGLSITELGRTATIGWLARRLERSGGGVGRQGGQPGPLGGGWG